MPSARHLEEIRRINVKLMQRDHWGLLFEEMTYAIYTSVIARGDTVVDCGGNIGEHTLSMARLCGPAGRVYTFEPVPDMMAQAQKRNSGFANITWIAKAAGAQPGNATFFYYPVEHGLSGLSHRPSMTSVVEEIQVEITTIDAEVAAPVSLLKLDIEGAEFNALQGARRILAEDAPIVVFENSRQPAATAFGYSKEDFFSFFEGLGYSLYFISGMPLSRELWEEAMHPWQFMALPKGNPRNARVFATTQLYLANLADG